MAKLKVTTSLYVLPKDEDVKLCTGLSHNEFKCRCDLDTCNETLVSPLLLKSYENLREHWGKPLVINSGYRCNSHNKTIGGSESSSHKLGLSMDISTRGFGTVDRDVFIKLCRKLFDYTREYSEWVHVQINPAFNKNIEF